jgi:signal transduction histidine kinase/ligand-binding sensor domain-containing protein
MNAERLKIFFYLTVVLLFIHIPFQGISQQSLWKSLDIEDGIPDPSVTCFLRVSSGLIYMGTSTGLYCFDGTEYRKVHFPDSLKINPFISSIGSDGTYIYAGARNALVRFNPADKSITSYKSNQTFHSGVNRIAFNKDSTHLYGLTHMGIFELDIRKGKMNLLDTIAIPGTYDFMVDEDGSLVIYTVKALIRYKTGNQQLILLDSTILGATWWEKENCWIIAKKNGLYRLQINAKKLIRLPYNVSFTPTSRRLLNRDIKELIWFFSDQGMGVLRSLNDPQPLFFSRETGNEATITSTSPNCYYCDPSGVLWAGGDGSGMSYQDKNSSKISFLSNENPDAGSFWFFKKLGETGEMLIGSSNGVFIGRVNGGHLTDLKHYHPPSINRFPVCSVIDYDHNDYLVATYGRGFWLMNKLTYAFKPHQKINAAIKTEYSYGCMRLSDGRILLQTNINPFIFDQKSQHIIYFNQAYVRSDNVFSAFEDKSGHLWLGTGLGLKIFDHNLELVHSYFSNTDEENTICSNVILDIKPGQGSVMYLATMGAGLCSYDTSSKKFNSIPLATSPVNVYGILFPDSDHLLLTTSNGLCLLNINTLNSFLINRSNVLPFNDFNQMAFYMDDSLVLVAGEKGMLSFKRNDIPDIFHSKQKISVLAGYNPISSIEVPAGKQSLDLTIILSKGLPHLKPVFEYLLEGVDDNYHRTSTALNKVMYNYLPPGKYTLHIRLVDETGYLTADNLSIPVVVKPKFWQTIWFRIIAFLLVILAIFFIVRYFSYIRLRWKLQKLDAERKVSQERSRISRELHDNLGSQLTYLISGLEATEMLIEYDKLDQLPSNLDKLQQAARESMQQLRDSVWALAPGSMNSNGLAIQFEKWFFRIMENKTDIRCAFINQLQSNLQIDPIIGLNLFRIMQESVHNTLKHAGAGMLKVVMKENDEQIQIIAEDDGKGIQAGSAEGHGLISMKQRAADIHAEIKIVENHPNGTIVEIVIAKNRLNG